MHDELTNRNVPMNIIYLHGFKSSALSVKGQQLKEYCKRFTKYHVHLPDLNCPPNQVMQKLGQLIERLDQVALVGSSLGGFYATLLVANYGVPAVLINPAVQPWQLFAKLYANQLPYQVNHDWCIDQQQLDDLEQMAITKVENAAKILVLLQQGDEVLDYRVAQAYYTQAPYSSLLSIDAQGEHAMPDFAEKLPMLLEFLTYSIKK